MPYMNPGLTGIRVCVCVCMCVRASLTCHVSLSLVPRSHTQLVRVYLGCRLLVLTTNLCTQTHSHTHILRPLPLLLHTYACCFQAALQRTEANASSGSEYVYVSMRVYVSECV